MKNCKYLYNSLLNYFMIVTKLDVYEKQSSPLRRVDSKISEILPAKICLSFWTYKIMKSS